MWRLAPAPQILSHCLANWQQNFWKPFPKIAGRAEYEVLSKLQESPLRTPRSRSLDYSPHRPGKLCNLFSGDPLRRTQNEAKPSNLNVFLHNSLYIGIYRVYGGFPKLGVPFRGSKKRIIAFGVYIGIPKLQISAYTTPFKEFGL